MEEKTKNQQKQITEQQKKIAKLEKSLNRWFQKYLDSTRKQIRDLGYDSFSSDDGFSSDEDDI